MAEMKPVEIGEILIVQDRETRKKFSGEVVGKHKNKLKIETVDNYGDCETHEVAIGESHNVLAYLGATPNSGSVYGCQVRKLYGQSEHKFWGVISFFRFMTDEEKDILKGALKSAQTNLKKLGLDKLIQLDNLVIQESKGRYAGMYKSDRHGAHILYHPKDIDPKFSRFLMDHELSHAIWYQLLQDKAKAQWVRLYTKYVEQTRTQDDTLAEIIDVIVAEARYLDEYQDLVSEIEDGNLWLDRIEYALMNMLLLTREDVDLYLWSSTKKERRKLLDRVMVSVSPLDSDFSEKFPISDYARKNVKEFFAEAYCHYISYPKRVPSDVEELLIETVPNIELIKGSALIAEDEDEEEDEEEEYEDE